MPVKPNSFLIALFTAAGIFATAAPSAAESPQRRPIERAPEGSVNLYRDEFGQPHLYARREEDAYFGLGYATAQDRLPAILLFYRYLRGELAAAFGPGPIGDKPGIAGIRPIAIPDSVQSDLNVRQWRYLADARDNLKKISKQRRKNVRSFMAGLQKYMDEHPEDVPSWAPKLEDALPLAAEAFLMLGNESPPGDCAAVEGNTSAHPEPALKGSNIWALSASRTADKASVFASDSHGEIEFIGSLFQAARISSDGLDSWMLDIVGMPMGLKGHSRHFAWGWAEGPRFPADCIRIVTLPEDNKRFRYDNRILAMETVPYQIEVKGSAPVNGQFEYTFHNNIRSPVVRRDGNVAFAISSTYFGRQGRAGDAFSAMLRAKNWSAMHGAVGRLELYPANIAITGADGGIFYIRPGRIPIRPEGADPSANVDGNSSSGAWRGIRPVQSLVQVKNPPEGYITNENVSPDQMFATPKFDPAKYPRDFAFEPGQTGTRQIRAIALLGGNQPLTHTDLLNIQGDVFIPGHERWGRLVSKVARGDSADEAFKRFVSGIAAFDGHFTPDSSAALGHALWRLELRESYPDIALSIEQNVVSGTSLTPAQADALKLSAIAAFDKIKSFPQGLDTKFGDIFRIGRGPKDHPSRGLTLLPLPGDTEGISDFGSLWSSIYEKEKDGDRYRSVSGTRWPFMVQFTSPIRSYSMTVFGQSDDPDSPYFSDQSRFAGAAKAHSNFFEPADLAAQATTLKVIKTRSTSK